MSELLQRIANYFVYQYKGNDKVAPKMDMSVDDLRNIVVLHVEKCKLEAELRNLQYVKTNADRIRNMSDEELAEFIQKIKNTCFVDFIGYANKDCEQDKISCKDCQAKAPTILEWLQSEADRRKYEQ